MVIGWIFIAISFSAILNSSPARTTTDVVPSPTSSSWVLEISEFILRTTCSLAPRIKPTNRKKRIMVGFGLFQGHLERIANSKSELTGELCYTDQH